MIHLLLEQQRPILGGSIFMSHTKKVKLWKMDSHHLFKQFEKHSGWLFPAQGQFQGHPFCFFSLAFFFWSFFWRPKNVKLGAASGKQRFGAWRWGLGRDVFRVDVASGNRMKKHSRHYDSAWKNIGISGHYLIGNWFSAGF